MSTLDRMNSLEKKQQTIEQLFSATRERMIALDHAIITQAKTLSAVVQVLTQQLPNFNDSVMDVIRLNEDKEDKDRMENMLAAGMIEQVEFAKEDTVVVLEQYKDGKKLMGHYSVAFNNPDRIVAGKLNGLKAGDSFESDGFNFNVLAVYASKTPA